jgi:exopolysaccharide biosynthesis WecB/TagA/CpsF family protein
VGSGDEAIHASLRTLIATHRLDDVVRLHGYVGREALEALLGECGYAISASRYEGYGMAMVEAMSAGLLPVMQPNLAFQELHSQCPCGILTDFEKPSQAAQQFLVWEKTADLELRHRARTYALSQSWTAVADEIDNQYAQSVANRRPPRDGFAVRRIAGVDISVCSRAEAFAFLCDRLEKREKTGVAFANANLIVKANGRAQSLAALSGMVIFNDGIGVDLASRLLFAKRFPANLNGTDFTPAFLAACPPGTRVYLFGARKANARAAAEVLAHQYGVTVCGFADGYGSSPDVVSEINAASADVVLVALGNPAQEEWIARYRDEVAAPLIIGVGALFDFLAGAVPRAPVWVRNMHMEWAFRLLQEPRRLARRYTIEIMAFLKLVIGQKIGLVSTGPGHTDVGGDERAA